MIRVAFAGNSLRTPKMWLEALARCPGRFEAICDTEEDRATEAAQLFGARWSFASLREMLAETQPDVVVLAGVEVAERARHVREVLRGRCHVVAVDPPARDVGAWDRLSKQAANAKRFVMLGAAYHFSPANERLRELLDSAVLGGASQLSMVLRRWTLGGSEGPGGPLMGFETVFEVADRVCGLLGPAKWVATTPMGTGGVSAVLHLQNGASAAISAAEVAETGSVGVRICLIGKDGGMAELVDDVRMEWQSADAASGQYAPRMAAGAQPDWELGYQRLLAAAVEAAEAGTQPPATLEQLRHSLVVCRALVTSSRGGRAVSIGVGKGQSGN
jgi:predicted dehydrogenase